MYVWENTRATTHPAAQSLPPNSTSMDALVVGLAPKKGASKKEIAGTIGVGITTNTIAKKKTTYVDLTLHSHPVRVSRAMRPRIVRHARTILAN